MDQQILIILTLYIILIENIFEKKIKKMDDVLSIKETMPLFAPKYDKKYYEKFTKLKVQLKNEDFGEETKNLANFIISKDPSNYNAWYCKKQNILKKQISEENIQNQRKFANECLGQKAKSFQVWQQKRFLTELDKNYTEEMTHIENILLGIDHKNYHAWSYRIWIITQTKHYLQQLQFAQKMIEKDLLNNSSWSYRFFLIENLVKDKSEEERQIVLKKEVEFTLVKIFQAKANKASWNYLNGLFPSIKLAQVSSKNQLKSSLIDSYDSHPTILQLCLVWLAEVKGQSKDPLAVYMHREIASTLVHIYSQNELTKDKARDVCEELMVIDRQKSFYWGWVKMNL